MPDVQSSFADPKWTTLDHVADPSSALAPDAALPTITGHPYPCGPARQMAAATAAAAAAATTTAAAAAVTTSTDHSSSPTSSSYEDWNQLDASLLPWVSSSSSTVEDDDDWEAEEEEEEEDEVEEEDDEDDDEEDGQPDGQWNMLLLSKQKDDPERRISPQHPHHHHHNQPPPPPPQQQQQQEQQQKLHRYRTSRNGGTSLNSDDHRRRLVFPRPPVASTIRRPDANAASAGAAISDYYAATMTRGRGRSKDGDRPVTASESATTKRESILIGNLIDFDSDLDSRCCVTVKTSSSPAVANLWLQGLQ